MSVQPLNLSKMKRRNYFAFKNQLSFLFVAIIMVSCTDDRIGDLSEFNGEVNEVALQTYEQHGTIIPGQYIVQFQDDHLDVELKNLSSYVDQQRLVRSAYRKVARISEAKADEVVLAVYSRTIKGVAVRLTPEEVVSLRANASVKLIEPDRFVALGPGGGKGKPGGGGGSDPQVIPWGIGRVGGAGNGVGKTAWIIDSGIDLDHPDLNVDVARSRSFLGGKEADNPDDQNGHGTHVAGTVAALDNSIGVVGVAAGATVISIRVLDRRGSGSLSGVIAGVDYVAANGSVGDVANMSLGGGVSVSLDNAVISAAQTGVKFSLAAGNESDDANNHSPARANGANIYTISAMDVNDNFANFSNYGTAVDYCSPGVSIHSCWKGGDYSTISGTSMAAPHMTGLLLLGNISVDGFVNNDPDGNADPIAHR